MKNKVLIDYETDEEEYCEKRWQSFITLAVRRFIIFVSAIRKCSWWSTGSWNRITNIQ